MSTEKENSFVKKVLNKLPWIVFSVLFFALLFWVFTGEFVGTAIVRMIF